MFHSPRESQTIRGLEGVCSFDALENFKAEVSIMELEKAPRSSDEEINSRLAKQEAAYPSRKGWSWSYFEFDDGRCGLMNHPLNPDYFKDFTRKTS